MMGILVCGFPLSGEAVDNTEITFTSTIPVKSCSVTVAPTTLALSVSSASFTRDTQVVGESDSFFTVSLGDCGLGGAQKPTVTVTGQHPPVAPAGADVQFVYLDADPSVTSKGYFIALGKKEDPNWGTGPDGVWGDPGYNTLISGETGESGAGKTVNVYPGVFCGRLASCASAVGGSLKATLTFAFEYK
ncbi:hypothetical protein QOM18_25510 [Serratia marcescens]|uniref:hypothetical protein n=1 Tax=Serratia marcescens TaxID=615 RepID=UPI0024C4A7EA|nr:hypothetical protein [Serratia marcescens]MDK1711681.1 hypothetical protein [Serratia marcescens]